MPRKGVFGVELLVNGDVLREVADTTTARVYAVARAGDEYTIRLSGDGTNIYGAIIQVDGVPKEEDFPKSPFTYFRNAYSDPGFWIKPSEGKYAPRKFTQPKTVDQSHANTSTDDIGRIRVYFFEVVRKDPTHANVYSAPGSSTVAESKKWYLASNATRYGNARTSGQKGGSYQIKDRKNWLGTVELWYKDAASLELLGWDKKSDSFRFILPWEKAKQEAAKASENSTKRRIGPVIDLTHDDSDDDEISQRKKKAKGDIVVVD